MRVLPSSASLYLALAVIYLLSAKGYVESLDTDFSIATAESIVSHGRLDVPDHQAGYTIPGVGGKSYSKFGIGLALYFTPFVAMAHGVAAVTGWPEPDLAGFLISFSQIPFALLVLLLFARQLRRFNVSPPGVLLLTLALGLGTLCWHYAVCDLSEEMQAALLLAAYGSVIRPGRRSALTAGTAMALLVLVKLVHVTLLPLFMAYLLTPLDEPFRARVTRSALFLGPVAVIGFGIAWLNQIRFGSLFESGYGAEASLFFPQQMWKTVPALLLSPDKGILLFSPVLLLGLFGFRAFFRQAAREAALCVAIVAVGFLITASWHSWGGGWSWGPRLLVPILPVAFLAAGFSVDRIGQSRGYALPAALTALSILVQVPSVLINDQEIHRIREELLHEDERPFAVPDFSMAWILARQKIEGRPERYPVSMFGVPGDRELDLTGYRSFRGVNLWTEQAARRFGRGWVRLIPLAGLLMVVWLLAAGWAAKRDWPLPSQQVFT
jgi:hypothetical protein